MFRKPLIPLAAFTLAYLLGFGALVVVRRNTEFLLYGGVMVLLIGLVLTINSRVRFTGPVLWGLSLWGFLHLAGGNIPIPQRLANEGGSPVLYSLWLIPGTLKYDQLVHAFGFFVSAFACHQAIRGRLASPGRVSFGLAIGLALMSMGLGAANEVVEFAATRVLPNTNVGGYVNTGWDLVSNAVGAFSAAAILWLRHRPRASA